MYKPGDLLLIPFPYSDLSASKKRPILVFSEPDRFGDFLTLPITSQSYHECALELQLQDIEHIALPKKSWVRFDKLYTLNEDIVVKKFGNLSPHFFSVVKLAVCRHLGCC